MKGLVPEKAAATYNKLAGEKVAPVLAKPDAKLPKANGAAHRFGCPTIQVHRGGRRRGAKHHRCRVKPDAVSGEGMDYVPPQSLFQTVTCRPDLVKTVEQLDLVVSCDVYF